MLRHWAYIATLAPSRLRWRVAEMKPGTCRTELSVAWISRLTSCCCFSGSTLKTLIRVMSFLSFVIFIMIDSSFNGLFTYGSKQGDYFELFGSFRSAINPSHGLFVVARSGHGFWA